MKTIYDTDFADGGGAVPYRGTGFARPGEAGDMAGEPRRGSDASTRSLPDRGVGESDAPSVA